MLASILAISLLHQVLPHERPTLEAYIKSEILFQPATHSYTDEVVGTLPMPMGSITRAAISYGAQDDSSNSLRAIVAYDPNGNISRIEYHNEFGGYSGISEFEHGDCGLTRVVLRSGPDQPPHKTQTFQYDANCLLIGATSSRTAGESWTANVVRSEDSAIVSVVYSGGNHPRTERHSLACDTSGKIMTDMVEVNGTETKVLKYIVDSVGRVEGKIISTPSLGETSKWTLEYCANTVIISYTHSTKDVVNAHTKVTRTSAGDLTITETSYVREGHWSTSVDNPSGLPLVLASGNKKRLNKTTQYVYSYDEYDNLTERLDLIMGFDPVRTPSTERRVRVIITYRDK